MAMGCIDCHDYMDGYNSGKREGTIEELEDIKSKMYHMLESDEVNDDYWKEIIKNKAHLFISIIDNRISELKGQGSING